MRESANQFILTTFLSELENDEKLSNRKSLKIGSHNSLHTFKQNKRIPLEDARI